MAKAPKNPIIARSADYIGRAAAEDDDEFLFECFVDTRNLGDLQRTDSPYMVALGRTGSGKTAILRYIEKHSDHSTSIDPLNMSLSYVSNSDIMRFLDTIGADLDIFFQTLWKHVLCLQYIRSRFDVKDEQKSRNIYAKFTEWAKRDHNAERAVKYFRDWEGRFWIDMDENIKEITYKTEQDISAELGADIEKFKAKASYEKQLSVDKKAEIRARARKIIAGEQIGELSKVLELLGSDEFRPNKGSYYILIDKLDESWIDDSIKFRLIRALIEALKGMRRVHGLKIVIALRTDVLERVLQEPSPSGFQREKYDSYMSNVLWSKDDLKKLVNKRINFLFRRKYTKENVTFDDIFRHQIGGRNAFDYMIERTLLRPRDIIAFVNLCLSRSAGEQDVNPRHIKEAEAEYSRARMVAMQDEWAVAFPCLPLVTSCLTGKPASQEITDTYSSTAVDELALRINEFGYEKDPLSRKFIEYIDGKTDISVIRKNIASVLYRVGVIGLKKSPSEPFSWSHLHETVVDAQSLPDNLKLRVHPMLHRVWNIGYERE